MRDDLRSRLLAALDQGNHGGGITREMAVDAMLDVVTPELDEWRNRAEKAEREAEERRLAYNAVNAMSGVHKLRADRLKAELEHAKGALAGDSEAMSAFMADHAKVVARARDQCDMWQKAAEQAEAAIDRAHALAQRWTHEPHPTHDHLCPDELRRDLLAALDDTPETGRG
jgi:anthranilate phosphoribosyltransferase